MANRDAPNKSPKNDPSKGGATPSEKKGFWKRKFTGGNAGKSIKEGFSLARLVVFLMIAIAIISFVHGAKSPPTLRSFLELLRNAPTVRIDILNIPKLDFGTGIVFDTLEKVLNSLVTWFNLGNVGAVSIYNLLTTLWYLLAYLTIF